MNFITRRVLPQKITALHIVNRVIFRGLAEPVSRNRCKTIPADTKPVEAHPYVFRDEVHKIITKVEASVQAMIPLNGNFAVARPSDEELLIQTTRGKYSFKPDHSKKILIMQSYITGYQNYYFDPAEGQWLSVKDNHDMRGLFTRDIVRHCVGCPKFD